MACTQGSSFQDTTSVIVHGDRYSPIANLESLVCGPVLQVPKDWKGVIQLCPRCRCQNLCTIADELHSPTVMYARQD